MSTQSTRPAQQRCIELAALVPALCVVFSLAPLAHRTHAAGAAHVWTSDGMLAHAAPRGEDARSTGAGVQCGSRGAPHLHDGCQIASKRCGLAAGPRCQRVVPVVCGASVAAAIAVPMAREALRFAPKNSPPARA